MSASCTILDKKLFPYIKKLCKRDILTGKIVTGGIITAKDSS
jgi:oleate hydratase